MSTITTTEPTKVGVHIVPRLPPELWLLIIRFATSAPIISPFEFAYYYEPFRSRHHEDITACFDAALRDKCAIMSVCRQWYALVGDTRYEDIRIERHIVALYAVLIESAPAPAANIVDGRSGTGTITARHCVRRAVLPYAHTELPTYYGPSALAFLALLPHLEVLVRPPLILPAPPRQQRRVRIPIPDPTTSTIAFGLPSLRRLEWAFEDEGGEPLKSRTNVLYYILVSAPSLHELVLTGPMPRDAFSPPYPDVIHLRALHTLRLHDGAGACRFIAYHLGYLKLPALENVVVEGRTSAQSLMALWRKFRGQVRVLELELGGGIWGGVSIGDVSRIVTDCFALEELNLRVPVEGYLNVIPEDTNDITWSCTHYTLQRIRIRIDSAKWSVETWMKILEYIGKFGKGCPALSQVVLYVLPEQVEVTLQNPQYNVLREILLSSGRQLLLHLVHV